MFEVSEEGDGLKGLAETLKTVSCSERMVLANIMRWWAKDVRHPESRKEIIQLTAGWLLENDGRLAAVSSHLLILEQFFILLFLRLAMARALVAIFRQRRDLAGGTSA
jgi:hypothetical protein